MAEVRLVRERGHRFLVSEQPLTVVEVTERGRRLLEAAGDEQQLRGLAPAEVRFLRRLRDLGLLEFRPAPAGPPPTVSVIVPVRDRPEQLADCLRSLEGLDHPPDRREVIVVDDGSAVPIPARAGVRVVRAERSAGPAAARNLGAGAARGEVLAFLDSDCTAEAGWLEELLPEFADPEVAAVGGRVRPARERTWLERYEAVRSPLDLGPRYAQVRPRHPVSYVVTANLLVRRTDFGRLGGFDPQLRCGEDVDLAWRLAASGRRVVYQPRGVVLHRHPHRLRRFLGTRAAYAASEGPLLRRHPQNGRFFGLSPGLGAFLAASAAALLAAPPSTAMLGALALAVECCAGARALAGQGLPIELALGASLRAHGWGLYYPARQLARYGLLPATLLTVAAGRYRRRLLIALAAALVTPSLFDWSRLRPELSPVRYLAAQLLDDLAYNAGVIRGCVGERTLAPLAVDVRISRRHTARRN